MPVKFNQPDVQRADYVRIVSPRVNEKLMARLAADRGFHLETDVHYLLQEKRTQPCLHEDCKLCPMPTRSIVYVPALASRDGQAWRKIGLIVTTSWRDILKQPLDKWIFTLSRGAKDNSPVTWAIKSELSADAPPFDGFDLMPSLYRTWGLKPPAESA